MVPWFGMIIRTFFWWSWKENKNIENIQHTTSWFVEELTISWNLSDQPILQPNNKNEYSELKVMMPRYFYNSWWKKFAENLYSWEKIYINFIFVDNLNRYRDTVSEESFSGADIILIPLDRKDSIHTKSFSFQKDIQFLNEY